MSTLCNTPRKKVELNDAVLHAAIFLAAKQICSRLQQEGYEAYLVGGAVRDILLLAFATNTQLKVDIDIATSAPPNVVSQLFDVVGTVGKSFAVTLVRQSGFTFEVACFRKDGSYSDHRRPDSISFGTIWDDSCRRDFTVNALYLDPVAGEVVDFHNGLADLQQGLLRAVGNAEIRFNEDALRLLRLFRFSANLGFAIEAETFYAARKCCLLICYLAKERILAEIAKVKSQAVIIFLVNIFDNLEFENVFSKKISCDNLPEFDSVSYSGLRVNFCSQKIDANFGSVFKSASSDLCVFKQNIARLYSDYPCAVIFIIWLYFKSIKMEKVHENWEHFLRALIEWPTKTCDKSLLNFCRLILSGEPQVIQSYREDKIQEDKIQEDKIQEDKIQEDKIQEDKIQEDKIQEDKIQEDKIQEDKIQEGHSDDLSCHGFVDVAKAHSAIKMLQSLKSARIDSVLWIANLLTAIRRVDGDGRCGAHFTGFSAESFWLAPKQKLGNWPMLADLSVSEVLAKLPSESFDLPSVEQLAELVKSAQKPQQALGRLRNLRLALQLFVTHPKTLSQFSANHPLWQTCWLKADDGLAV